MDTHQGRRLQGGHLDRRSVCNTGKVEQLAVKGYHPDSLAWKISDFLRRNSDEYLTYSDIAAKFEVSIDSSRRVVEYLKRSGAVETMHIVRARSANL